jgi:hypothetical protein
MPIETVEQIVERTEPDPVSDLDRVLTDLKIWMLRTLERKEYRGERDRSGHPHGYTVCTCPEWELRQKLDVMQMAKDLVVEIGKRLPCR